MKGRITKVWRTGTQAGAFGFILGEDGVSYYFNKYGIQHMRKLKADYIVEFEPSISEDGAHAGEPKAINVIKVGHGKHHPLALNTQRIADYISTTVPDDDPDKAYRLRDLQVIYNYFCNVEDSQIYADPRKPNNTKEE